ncbi:class I SAM-dependent methyltransferase [Roseateles sp. DB2]|uniref:class I SAM-dependent methyltransferase n=1 Tax=Roseateles sp. DB2 TaxID=3453717 RepID=UPI003EF076EC
MKTAYITLLQEKALQKYIGHGTGKALDVGCAYGRMCQTLAGLGYQVTGVEPSARVLEVAARLHPGHEWIQGSMPNLPFEDESFELVCLFNVARPLHLLNIAAVCSSITRLVKPGGRLVVIDNLREGDSRYLPQAWFDATFARDGLVPSGRIPIRASRWPLIYLIRYGLIPQRWFEAIANWELRRMSKRRGVPRLSYYNYLFIYTKA